METINTSEALAWGTSAPFIVLLLGLVKSWVTLPDRWIPTMAIGLSGAWGGVLIVSDLWTGTLAIFIVTMITVGFAASGMQSALRAVAPNVAKIGPNA